MKVNKLLERLRNREIVYGPFVRMNSPEVIECFGYGGFDFVIIDLEHSAMNFESAENLVRAADISGIIPIIRIRKYEPSLVQKALDTGASGVQIPQINTSDVAISAVESAKFYPDGTRGVCRFTRSAKYSHIHKNNHFATSNSEVMVVLQVEGTEGVNNIDKILDVSGIDVIFIGPYDLSQSLGVPGEVDSPIVINQIQKITEKALRKNIIVGAFVDNLETARLLASYGITYLATYIDTGLLYESTKTIVNQIKKEIR